MSEAKGIIRQFVIATPAPFYAQKSSLDVVARPFWAEVLTFYVFLLLIATIAIGIGEYQ